MRYFANLFYMGVNFWEKKGMNLKFCMDTPQSCIFVMDRSLFADVDIFSGIWLIHITATSSPGLFVFLI